MNFFSNDQNNVELRITIIMWSCTYTSIGVWIDASQSVFLLASMVHLWFTIVIKLLMHQRLFQMYIVSTRISKKLTRAWKSLARTLLQVAFTNTMLISWIWACIHLLRYLYQYSITLHVHDNTLAMLLYYVLTSSS